MYVACPSCRTLYQIQAQHLHAAGGQVRCGSCRTTFLATDAVFDEPEQALAYAEKRHVERDIEALVSRALEQVPGSDEQPAAQSEPERPPSVERHDEAQPPEQQPEALAHGEDQSPVDDWTEPETPEPAYVPEDTQAADAWPPTSEPAPDASEHADEQEAAAPQAEPPAPLADEQLHREGAEPPAAAEAAASLPVTRYADLDLQGQPPAAEFVLASRALPESAATIPNPFLLEDEYRERVSHSAWGAIAAALLLTALLVGQYGYVERDRLASVPQLRPLLETGCRWLGCELPLRREIAKVEIVAREVRDHPRVADALLISATFVNRADFVQPFPIFSVSFSDVSGTLVSARRFRPDEYLPHGQGTVEGMQPGQRAYLTLEVFDPGQRAVSFQFDFL